MPIPDTITREHVLKALADLEAGHEHPFGAATKYEVLHQGKRYSPKAAIGLAARYATGSELRPEDFGGGEGAGQANDFLRRLGFSVTDKELVSSETDEGTKSIDHRVAAELRSLYEQMSAAGKLLPRPQAEKCFSLFRERFGPSILASLDGEALLSRIHDHSNRDSLVYWLEFKNDDEFPAWFGSIAGGSALKFGIYRRKETGNWMTGSPQHQKEI